MSSIIDYIKKYQNNTFDEIEFNIIDNAIFTSLSYIDFTRVLKYSKKNKLTIEEAGEIYFRNIYKREINIFSITSAIKIFKRIYKTKRYKDLLLYNYSSKVDSSKQFAAMFININEYLTYISFEGTDSLVSGWREDVEMCYNYPVGSQKEAIKYINFHINPFSKRKYIVGGHSKGGNLALVGAMNANIFIKNKIKAIYMFDAPGLKTKQIESRKYNRVKERIKRIIPNHSVFGLFYYHEREPIVVKSMKMGLFAHNMLVWEVDDKEFVQANISAFSKKLDERLSKWLESISDTEREEVFNDLFEILDRANITSLLDIKRNTIKKIRTIINESKKIKTKTKNAMDELIKIVVLLIKEESTGYISSKILMPKH